MMTQHDLFAWIWSLNLLLALVAITVLLLLVYRRSISTKRSRLRAKRQDELITLFHVFLQSPVPLQGTDLPQMQTSDYPIIQDIALDMIRTIRGGYVDDVIKLVAELGLLPHLKTQLRNRKRSERMKALTLLGYFPDAESHVLLLQHMHDADPYVQMTALRGLARHADAIDASAVLRELGKSVRTNALMLADVLCQFGERYLPALHDLAASTVPGNESVRVAAILAIGNMSALSSVDVLRDHLRDPKARIRSAAVQALARLGDDSVAPAICALLNDESDEVRIQSAQALGHFKAETTLPGLAIALDDKSWWVRFRAAESLVHFGDTGIAVLRASGNQPGMQGQIASQVLAEMVPA